MSEVYKPAEVARGDMEALAAAPPWAADAWGLGCLMHELFAGERLASADELRVTGCVPPAVTAEYTKLLSQNPARRLNPNKARAAPAVGMLRVDLSPGSSWPVRTGRADWVTMYHANAINLDVVLPAQNPAAAALLLHDRLD